MAGFRLNPGELRHLITIEQPSASRSTSGEVVNTWTTFATVWAKIMPIRGREAEESRRETGKAEVRFWCRYLAGVTLGMRLVRSGRYFDITAIINIDELDKWLEISAVETI